MSTTLYGFIGLGAVAVGAISSAVGLNLLKWSAVLERGLPIYKRRRFMAGIFLTTIFNTALDTFAFSFVAVSVIAPFGGLCVVVAAMLAHRGVFGPREVLDRFQWACLAAIFGGVGLVGGFGPRPPPVTNSTIIFEDFGNAGFVWYQVVWGALTLGAYVGLHSKLFGPTSLWATVLFGSSAGMSSGITQCIMKAITSISAGATIVHGASYAWEYFPWTHPQLWRAIAQLVAAALLLLHAMNTCICSTDVGVSTAVYQSSVIVGSIVAGCAFWGDLDDVAPVHLFMFLFGIGCVVAGVFCLLTRHKKNVEMNRMVAKERATSATSATLTAASATLTAARPTANVFEMVSIECSDSEPVENAATEMDAQP